MSRHKTNLLSPGQLLASCLVAISAVLWHGLASQLEAGPTTPIQQETPVREIAILIYLADVVEIAGSDQSFFADVFIRALWHDPELEGAFEEARDLELDDVWNPRLIVMNRRDGTPSLPEVVRVRPDGTVSYLQRITGRFSAPMDLRDFPFDRQEFHIWIVALSRAGERVELVPDTTAVVLRPEHLSISDWSVGEPTLRSHEFHATPDATPLPGLELVVQAQRLLGYYVIQVLIPLVAIVLMAWTVFWIDPSVVPTRVGVVVTTMLTLIAYRFMLANLVPRLSYLTRFDYFMLGATTLVIAALFAMAGTAFLRSQGRDAAVRKIDRAGRLLFPLAFVAFSLLVWLR